MKVSEMSDEMFQQYTEEKSEGKIRSIFMLTDIISRSDVISDEQLDELIQDAKELNVIDSDCITTFINEVYTTGTAQSWKRIYDSGIFPKEMYVKGAIKYNKINVLRYILDTVPQDSIEIHLDDDLIQQSEILNILNLEQAEKYFPILSLLMEHPKTKNSIFNQRSTILSYLQNESNSIWLAIKEVPYVMADQDPIEVKEEHDRKCAPLIATINRFTQVFNSLMIEDILKELDDDDE